MDPRDVRATLVISYCWLFTGDLWAEEFHCMEMDHAQYEPQQMSITDHQLQNQAAVEIIGDKSILYNTTQQLRLLISKLLPYKDNV